MTKKKTPKTILIIDDEASIRQSFADCLEDREFRTLTAENGRIGLEMFESEGADLVLVDLRMPEMDGLEVLSRITKMSPETPILMVSGTGMIKDAVEALRIGAWDYLFKPIEDFSVLIHAVTSNLEKARLIRENRKYQEELESLVAQQTVELKNTNKRLREERNYAKNIIQNSPSLICGIDGNGITTFINPTIKKVTGYGEEELIGFNWWELFYPGKEQSQVKRLFDRFCKGEVSGYEMTLTCKNGAKKTILWSSFTRRDPDDNIFEIIGFGIDITDRKKAEEQIRRDLEEKEVLLKEIHHRVKNNMNIVKSLLTLQSRKIESKGQAVAALTESCNRIYTMALIHDQLYKSENLLQIDMKTYIDIMTHRLKMSHSNKKDIQITLKVEGVYLDIHFAIPCGLILNELITNAFKHAFAGKPKGLIRISFQLLKNKSYKLTVGDNGVGLPQDIDIKNSQTLGLELINILCDQIHGKLEIKRKKGTTFIIRFQAPNS